MQNDKVVMKTESVSSDDGLHRILLRKDWDKNKPCATVIMIAPSDATSVETDLTTMLVINNIYRLGFGSVNIVNLYSKVARKLFFKGMQDEDLISPSNDNCIKTAVEKSDCTIVAWGSIGDNYKRVQERQQDIHDILRPHLEKVKVIADASGRIGLHPLSPSIRQKWELVPYVIKQASKITKVSAD